MGENVYKWFAGIAASICLFLLGGQAAAKALTNDLRVTAESLRSEVQMVEMKVDQHASSIGHPVTIAELSEIKRRLDSIDKKLDYLTERAK